jgi:hypothetical protein
MGRRRHHQPYGTPAPLDKQILRAIADNNTSAAFDNTTLANRSHEQSGSPNNATGDILIAVCIAGQMRSFNEPIIYRNIFYTMIQPIRHSANVFMALDSWSKEESIGMRQVKMVNSSSMSSGEKSSNHSGGGSHGVGNVVEVDLLPNHTLPAELMALFRPTVLLWGHASTPEACDGAQTPTGCAFNFGSHDMSCVPKTDHR